MTCADYNLCSFKMAANKDINMYFKNAKYKCLSCSFPLCMKCLVFESNENVPGWAAGKPVAYCEIYFEAKQQ